MKKTFCDWCGKELADGPVGAIVNVTVQPAYAPVESEWEICPEDARRIWDLRAKSMDRKSED